MMTSRPHRDGWLAHRVVSILTHGDASQHITFNSYITAKVGVLWGSWPPTQITCCIHLHMLPHHHPINTQAAALKQGDESATRFVYNLIGADPLQCTDLHAVVHAAVCIAIPQDANTKYNVDLFCTALAQGYGWCRVCERNWWVCVCVDRISALHSTYTHHAPTHPKEHPPTPYKTLPQHMQTVWYRGVC